jgi:hypothetical protein
VFVNAPNTVIEGNFIGTNAAGDTDLGNVRGVFIAGAPNNTVGGRSTPRPTPSPATSTKGFLSAAALAPRPTAFFATPSLRTAGWASSWA